MLPEKYACLVHHDDDEYERVEMFYECEFHSTYDSEYSSANPKPSIDRPARVPLVPCVDRRQVWCEELNQMEDICDWEYEPPSLAYDLAQKFLARVHSFTTLGLEAQATAFSLTNDGVIKYIALLPQRNRVSSVEDSLGEVTELDAVNQFSLQDQLPSTDGYIQRCWIHTHPRFKAFMSSVDIFQLFMNARTNPRSFGIVFSPRGYGVKALCVHITKTGLSELERFYNQALALQRERRELNVKEYVLKEIHSSDSKFYCQIPFILGPETCVVADLRRERDVVHQLRSFIVEGDPDDCWISH